MPTSNNWEQRLSDDLILRGLSERTRAAYLRVVRQFLSHVNLQPADITNEVVRDYFLYLHKERKLAGSSINVALQGLRHFFSSALGRECPALVGLRIKKSQAIPIVFSRGEVRTVLAAIRQPVSRMAITLGYAVGLRLSEIVNLQSHDIDGQRLMVWVRLGKGDKDRGLPLPRPVLRQLRHYWKHDRPPSRTSYLLYWQGRCWADRSLGNPENTRGCVEGYSHQQTRHDAQFAP